ncbi:MAG: hypothetical protein ABJ327_16530 [Litoreibacter sp.]
MDAVLNLVAWRLGRWRMLGGCRRWLDHDAALIDASRGNLSGTAISIGDAGDQAAVEDARKAMRG